MKLHCTAVDYKTPWTMYSCASRVVSYLTGRKDINITRQVMRWRIHNHKWSRHEARRSTTFMYDYEIRFLLRRWLRNTRIIVPRKQMMVHALPQVLKSHEYALVMVPDHVMIIHNGFIYDVCNANGTRIENCCEWRNAKVLWYQRLKE